MASALYLQPGGGQPSPRYRPAYPSPRAPLRPLSLYTMLVLAYCAGLRLGELARLNLGDVDLQVGHDHHPRDEVLQIQDPAIGRQRAVGRCGNIWRRDARQRRRRAPNLACSGTTRGMRATRSQSIAWCLVDILRRAGMKPPKGKTGPRIHDLRHSMVVNRILEWYRAGINPQDGCPSWRPIWGTAISTRRWSTSRSPRNCCSKRANASAQLAPPCLHVEEGVQP